MSQENNPPKTDPKAAEGAQAAPDDAHPSGASQSASNGAGPGSQYAANGSAQGVDTASSEAAAPAAPLDPIEALKAELAASQAKASENYDSYLRAVADAENIRRRSMEDVAKAHKFAVESFAESLLPAKDSLEMALILPDLTTEKLKEGVEATLRQLKTAFEKNKLMEVSPVGEKFDPHKHQAISTMPGASATPPLPANHVAQVLQKGYTINDRVLRPALVVVTA
jgi:molecular chaperone GrpE